MSHYGTLAKQSHGETPIVNNNVVVDKRSQHNLVVTCIVCLFLSLTSFCFYLLNRLFFPHSICSLFRSRLQLISVVLVFLVQFQLLIFAVLTPTLTVSLLLIYPSSLFSSFFSVLCLSALSLFFDLIFHSLDLPLFNIINRLRLFVSSVQILYSGHT